MPAARSLERPEYFLNSELSWLGFNRRVLEEAQDDSNPLLERVKFLAITASNLDEFFEVRIAALLQRIEDGQIQPGPDGLSPLELRDRLISETHDFVDEQYRCWNEDLRPALTEAGVCVLQLSDLDEDGRQFVSDYCDRELDPLLTPITIDPAHPFPRVLNKALCQAMLLRRKRRTSNTYLGVVTVPRALPRLVRLPNGNGQVRYVFLADLVATHVADLYRGYDILSSAAFRITRNSNLYLQEEESRSLLESVRTELHNRRRGDAVRMEIEVEATDDIVERLRNNFEIEDWQVYRTMGAVNLSRLMFLYKDVDRRDLKYQAFTPHRVHLHPRSAGLFDEIRRRDILLHHPFDSYDPVVSFVEAAARDPQVLSIKQTLYRTNDESPIVAALVDAAATKEVATVVELKARFDEAPNIRLARELEEAGVQVFHGVVGLKTHCKLALLARKDDDGVVRRYAHLGTGNYNPVTAELYTDLSLFTANPEITTAVNDVFNFLTAYADQGSYDPLLLAPVDLADQTLALITREAEHARQKRPARIIAKMNGLLDKAVITELYRASQAGVPIDLIVRGRCALRPGVPGVSTRIRVRSIVGRFLEHSRIFYFLNGGNEQVYLGSADWMPRNLYERVEVEFPVRDARLARRIRDEILGCYLADTVKARLLATNGNYTRPSGRKQSRFNAQEHLIAVAEGTARSNVVSLAPRPTTERKRIKTG
jgi:polyphosphate kinase